MFTKWAASLRRVFIAQRASISPSEKRFGYQGLRSEAKHSITVLKPVYAQILGAV